MSDPEAQSSVNKSPAKRDSAANAEQTDAKVIEIIRELLRRTPHIGVQIEEYTKEFGPVGFRESSTPISGEPRLLTNTNPEGGTRHQIEVQTTNHLEAHVLDRIKKLAQSLQCFLASSDPNYFISLLPMAQTSTRCTSDCQNPIIVPHAPGDFIYAIQGLDAAGRRQLAKDLVLPCSVMTQSGLVGFLALQDSGAGVSVISKKTAEGLGVQFLPLDSEIILITIKGDDFAYCVKPVAKALVDLRLPCRADHRRITFVVVETLPGIQAYLSMEDALAQGHNMLVHCELCARAL